MVSATYLPDEVAVALCIYGVDLDPQEVTLLLGVDPTHAHRRGERSSLRSPPYDKGVWIREVRRFDPIHLNEMIDEVLRGLPVDPLVWQRLAQRFQVRFDFAVHTDVGGTFVLSSPSVRRIAGLGAEFHIYIQAYGDNGA
jgi:hypothetical protein